MKTRTKKVGIVAIFLAIVFLAGCGGGGAVSKPNTSPKARIAVSPSNVVRIGQQMTVNASGSTDAETASADLQVRWDFNNDGVWDTASSTVKTAGHTYTVGGQYTVRVAVSDEGGLSSQATTNITVFACSTDTQCDDSNPSTIDSCVNPGAANSSCSYASVACSTDSACDDTNPLTADTCVNPGAANSSCSHTPVACAVNSDCNDSNTHTEDACINGGTLLAACTHTAIVCLSNGDAACNDGVALTIDTCSNAGTTSSACVNTPFTCNNAADCGDGNELTIDSCSNGGTLASACVHTAIACVRDANCNDSNGHTTDSCVNPGTTDSVCSNILNIGCLDDNECNCQPGDPGCQNSTPFDPLTMYGFCAGTPGAIGSECQVTFR